MSPTTIAVDVKTLQINGENVSARADQTILEVARENGIYIPTLCHLDGLTDVGACRLCLIEIKGSPKSEKAASPVFTLTQTPDNAPKKKGMKR